MTLSLPDDAAAYLEEHGGHNASAFVAGLLRRDAVARSAAAHAQWYREHPDFAGDAEAERDRAVRPDA